MARVARFYGWTNKDILSLTPKRFWAYHKHAHILQSEEQLQLISAISIPNMKHVDRKRVIHQLQTIVDPRFEKMHEKANTQKINYWKKRFGGKRKK